MYVMESAVIQSQSSTQTHKQSKARLKHMKYKESIVIEQAGCERWHFPYDCSQYIVLHEVEYCNNFLGFKAKKVNDQPALQAVCKEAVPVELGV